MSFRNFKEDNEIIHNFCKSNNVLSWNFEAVNPKYKIIKDSRDGDNITYCLFDINEDEDKEPLAEISVDTFDLDLNL